MNSTTDMSPPELPGAEERNWATFAHLSALAALIVPGFGAVLGPLVIWLLKKNQLPFVNDQGREALNFQITVMIAGIVCWMLAWIFIGVLLFGLLALADLVCIILAAVKSSEGVAYRYPFNLRLIK
jgi:uncharacterized Tic20 family protein